MIKKILWITLLIIVVAASAFFSLAPGIIDKSVNKVIHTASLSDKESWYDSIPVVADLQRPRLYAAKSSGLKMDITSFTT